MTRLTTGFSPLVRNRIKARAGFDEHTRMVTCEGCGKWCAEGWYDVHHRIPRSAGGTKRAHVNEAANGLCFGRVCCHAFAESQRTEAMQRGWLISANRSIRPSAVPVLLHDGWFLLDDNGYRYPIPEPSSGEVA